MSKLPVFAVVGETYRFVWRERRLFWTLAVPGIIVISLVSALQKWAEWDRVGRPQNLSDLLHTVTQGSESTVPDDSLLLALKVIALLVESIVFVLYAVAWHRAYLVPGEPPSAASTYRWKRRQMNFAFSYLRLLLVFGPLLLVGFLLLGVAFPFLVETLNREAPEKIGWIVFPGALMLFGGIAFGIYLLTRLSLIFPAAAVDHAATLRRSWSFSKGHFWRLFWSGALVVLPLIILFPLQQGPTLLLWGTGWGGSLSAALLSSLVEQFFVFVSMALGVSVLSVCYRRLSAPA